MSLSTFFAINLPYGIKRNENNEWFAFNRDYIPIGWNSVNNPSIHSDDAFTNNPIYTKYKALTETKLLKIAGSEKYVKRDDVGKINMVYLYDDGSNPTYPKGSWKEYFDKIKELSNLKV
jgi:hypothetical protein